MTADPNTVWGYLFDESKDKDEQFLAIAVRDESGACAGGVIVLGPNNLSVADELRIDSPSECTGDAVAEAAGF